MFAWMRRLPQPAFWPFNRRQEALRIRLLQARRADARNWRGNLERRLTAVEELVVKMQANCLRHSAQLSRLNRSLPLTLPETEEAFGIPQTPSSPGGRRTTANPITDSNSDAQEPVYMFHGPTGSLPLAPTTTPIYPVGLPSESAALRAASKAGESTPAQDAPETG
jgi:hypothetical protein